MKLNTKQKIITITNKDFKDKEVYSFDIRVLTYRESMTLLEKHQGEDGELSAMSSLDYARDIFLSTVENWTGIEDEDGSVLECNDKNKEAIFNYDTDFCQNVISTSNEKLVKDKKK